MQFATFYSNSTAHYQHLYWRDFQPDRFGGTPTESAHPTHAGAIEYGYRAMDALLAKFMIDYGDARLILTTAHSQEPDTGDVYRFYRPHDFDALLAFARVEGAVVKPVMAEQFHLEVLDEVAAMEAERNLNGLMFDGRPVLWVTRDGKNVFAGCRYLYDESEDAPVLRTSDGIAKRFGDIFYRIDGTRSGMHHPDGVLWIRNGLHVVIDERVSILDIAPTILNAFGVAQPAYMRGRPLFGPSTQRLPEHSLN